MMPEPKAITMTLRGAHARRVIHELAGRFARLWLQDVATVRNTPRLTLDEAQRLADYRFALESFYPDLPPIAEPEYPERFLPSDEVVTKSKVVSIHGLAFRRVEQTKMRKGAKRLPTWSRNEAAMAAELWADEFCKLCGVK